MVWLFVFPSAVIFHVGLTQVFFLWIWWLNVRGPDYLKPLLCGPPGQQVAWNSTHRKTTKQSTKLVFYAKRNRLSFLFSLICYLLLLIEYLLAWWGLFSCFVLPQYLQQKSLAFPRRMVYCRLQICFCIGHLRKGPILYCDLLYKMVLDISCQYSRAEGYAFCPFGKKKKVWNAS